MRVPKNYLKRKRQRRYLAPLREYGAAVGLLCKSVAEAAKAFEQLSGALHLPWVQGMLRELAREQEREVLREKLQHYSSDGVQLSRSWVDELRGLELPVPSFIEGGRLVGAAVGEVGKLASFMSYHEQARLRELMAEFERIAVKQRRPVPLPVPPVRATTWRWLASKIHNFRK